MLVRLDTSKQFKNYNNYCPEGGVGWAATQLARSLDTSTDKVTIIGVTSKSKEEVAKGNGVDYVLNYDNFHEELKKIAPKGVDLFINNETTTYETDCKHLKPLGRVVILGKLLKSKLAQYDLNTSSHLQVQMKL